jgi:hypothetical protein
MSNKITTIGVTEWIGHNWFAVFMINPPLWLMAQQGGFQGFHSYDTAGLWCHNPDLNWDYVSRVLIELGLQVMAQLWVHLCLPQHSPSSVTDSVTCQFPRSQHSTVKLYDNYCSNGQGVMVALGLCMASYPDFPWLLQSLVCLVSMENK